MKSMTYVVQSGEVTRNLDSTGCMLYKSILTNNIQAWEYSCDVSIFSVSFVNPRELEQGSA